MGFLLVEPFMMAETIISESQYVFNCYVNNSGRNTHIQAEQEEVHRQQRLNLMTDQGNFIFIFFLIITLQRFYAYRQDPAANNQSKLVVWS